MFKLITIAAIAIILSTISSIAAADPVADQTETGISSWVKIGGGCVGGAILGTVVPGLGNAIGCIAGGLGGWLFGSGTSDTQVTAHAVDVPAHASSEVILE